MAEGVEAVELGSEAFEGQVGPVDHLVVSVETMYGDDPGVDQGDVYASASDSLPPESIGTDVRRDLADEAGIPERVIRGRGPG